MASDFFSQNGGNRLPAGGTLRYGAVTFGSFVATDVRVTPVYDQAGRTVVHNLFALTVRATLGGGATEPTVLAARRELCKPGLPLYYAGQGFGGLVVNVGKPTDVVWGPKPRELSFRPLGGGNGCELVWTVEVAAPDCGDAVFQGAVAEFGFRLEFDRDGDYTNRRMAAYVRIPSVRAGRDGRTVGDSPDNYLDKVIPPLMPGFERSFGTRTISEDKTRLEITVYDTEVRGKNVPPPYCLKAEASHRTANVGGRSYFQWAGTITARYELAKTAPSDWLPFRHFLGTVVKDRLAGAFRLADRRAKFSTRPQFVSLSLDEPEIYGRRVAAFSLSYTFGSSLANLVESTGLWRPVPGGGDWKAWAASLSDSAFHPLGAARLTFQPGEDAIVDLCKKADPRVGEGVLHGGTFAPPTNTDLIGQLFPTPNRDDSWLTYECEIGIETDAGVASLRTLPAASLDGDKPLDGSELVTGGPPLPKPEKAGSKDLFGRLDDLAGEAQDALDANLKNNGGGGGAYPAAPPASPIPPGFPGGGGGGRLDPELTTPPAAGRLETIRRARPIVYLYLRGRAARAGFRIPCPRLVRIEVVEPVPANRPDHNEGFWEKIGGTMGVVPVYHATWNLRYALPRMPAGPLPVPNNPLLNPIDL